MSKKWDDTPDHFNKLDLRGFLQDSEITQVEMEDAEPDQNISDTEERPSERSKKSGIPGLDDEDEVRFLSKRKSKFAVIID